MPDHLRCAAGAAVLAGAACGALAQTATLDLDEPTWDRWMYPFNFTPGTRATASVFAAIEMEGFDDRDAQFLLGFDATGSVPAGQGVSRYRVVSAVVTASVANDEQFAYDPTPDTWKNVIADTDPDYVADADPGRPVELFGVGYRDGYDATTFNETSPFGTPEIEPAENGRNAFAANFLSDGAAVNVSNSVRESFDPDALAVGAADLTPGTPVPADTTFTFTIDTSDPASAAYLRRSLDAGVLVFSVSSLHPATGGPDGGTGDVTYPIWYTRDNIVAILDGLTATISLEVFVGSPADLNADGSFNNTDINLFVNAFLAGDASADVNADGSLNNTDINLFVNAFLAG